jgi:hypothetical protein
MVKPLDASEMLQSAEQETGLTDWGINEDWGGDFGPAYQQFVKSLNEEARLSERGREHTRGRIMDILRGRLQMVDDRKRLPGLAQGGIKNPIFVIGLPRSGTTFMHHMLSQDPEHRAPQTWEVRLPSPPPDKDTYKTDSRIQKVQDIYREVGFLDQEIQEVHPTGAQRFEECPYMHAYGFVSADFAAYWDIPSYRDTAYLNADMKRMYRLQKSFLQHLQYRHAGKRWTLKSPGHMPYLEDLIAIFPDALLVNCIRDPAKVIASMSNAVARIRKRYSDQLPQSQSAAMEEVLTNGYLAKQALDFFKRHPERSDRIFHAQFVDVQADPMRVLKQIYEHFGIPLTPGREQVIADWLSKDRAEHSATGTHSYTLDDFGVDTATVDAHFRDWIDYFPIKLERGRAKAA